MTAPAITLDYLFFTKHTHADIILLLILELYSFGLNR